MRAVSEFLDYTIIDFTTEDADYPLSNLKEYESSTESYRTTDANLSQIDIDLGAAYQDPIVLLYRTNFASVKFYGDDASNFGTIDFTSATFTIEKDVELFLYKRAIQLTGFNQRYLRIEIPNQARLDGAAHYEIGIVAIFTSIYDFVATGESLGVPVENNQVVSELIYRSQSNRKKIIPIQEIPVIEFNISGTMKNTVANRTKMSEVFGHPMRSLVFMDRGGENNWQVYLLQRTGTMSFPETVGGNNGVRNYAVSYETIY